MIFACFNASAQTQKFKDFLRDCEYEIVVGFNAYKATEPFEEGKLGYNLGVTAVSYTHLDVYKRQIRRTRSVALWTV